METKATVTVVKATEKTYCDACQEPIQKGVSVHIVKDDDLKFCQKECVQDWINSLRV